MRLSSSDRLFDTPRLVNLSAPEPVPPTSIVPVEYSTMLQDPKSVRYYQRVTDSMVDLWRRGYRFDDLRLYVDGYLAALRHADVLEPYLIHRLEEETMRFLRDPSNFLETQPEPDYY